MRFGWLRKNRCSEILLKMFEISLIYIQTNDLYHTSLFLGRMIPIKELK